MTFPRREPSLNGVPRNGIITSIEQERLAHRVNACTSLVHSAVIRSSGVCASTCCQARAIRPDIDQHLVVLVFMRRLTPCKARDRPDRTRAAGRPRPLRAECGPIGHVDLAPAARRLACFWNVGSKTAGLNRTPGSCRPFMAWQTVPHGSTARPAARTGVSSRALQQHRSLESTVPG